MNTERNALLMHGSYGIRSTSSTAEVKSHVIKHGDTFAVCNHHGDITPVGNSEQGLYHANTRYLSRLELRIESHQPVLLSSTVRKDNTLLTADLTNPDVSGHDGADIPHDLLHFFRAKLLWEGTCYEHLRVRNYGQDPVDISFTYLLEADYVDLFEVRGTARQRRGSFLPEEVQDRRVVLGYRGLDDVVRKTQITASPQPDHLTASALRYRLQLPPHERADVYLAISCHEDDETHRVFNYEEAKKERQQEAKALKAASCEVSTSNEQFNAWINRSLEDLNLLLTDTEDGYYPYAGIPWYSTVFGRDGLLTALMTLWINPDIARGVLGHLARTQADTVDPENDAEPGKILHEARDGEMAALGEVPFRQYYGTVDATPLFVMLAGAYYTITGDRAFIEQIWPNIERALEWIDTYGDADDDGFVEYLADTDEGLTQQGWKDSEDSVFHADGRMAEGPIALCEVQGYVYAAKTRAALLAEALDQSERARTLRQEARQLKERFEEAFWCEDLGTYALALDGQKRPCKVRSSNAGQVLLSGIASREHAEQVAETLFAEDSFSGWGLRTLSTREQRYNPLSYHNGSIWPHDNALIGRGLARYGHTQKVQRLLRAFFDASVYEPLRRLPELFCGLVRRPGEGPTLYPVACAPQAWASAVPFCLLQACLGLTIEAKERCVKLRRPSLPPFLDTVRLRNLRVGDAGSVDLVFKRYARNVGVEVTRRDGDIEVMTVT